MQGRLHSPFAITKFMMAGNATITLISQLTKNRFTFRIRKAPDGGVHFVSVLTGTNNETDYRYLGFIRNGRYSHGDKSKISKTAPSATAFAWFFNNLQSNRLPPQVEVYHAGKCGRCGRPLTTPESIARGIGPECAQIMERAA